jgi:succinylglutamate desuccinylase
MNKLQQYSRQIARYQALFEAEKQSARQQELPSVTVYRVRETVVKRHKRKAFVAVRVKR